MEKTNRPDFVSYDPVSIPHRFLIKQDIEIAGFFAAIMAWGNRKTIINKCSELLERMDNSPYEFIRKHRPSDLKRLEGFVHRTLNDGDVLYLIDFLHRWYTNHESLESAFSLHMADSDKTVERGLIGFYETVFSGEHILDRTKKHIASPHKKSACKRLNMYLRWMVRLDDKDVDFGLWETIKPSQLICPLDVHVSRVALELGLLKRKQNDWLSALELTTELSRFDPQDPVKYDFALFGLGLSGFGK